MCNSQVSLQLEEKYVICDGDVAVHLSDAVPVSIYVEINSIDNSRIAVYVL